MTSVKEYIEREQPEGGMIKVYDSVYTQMHIWDYFGDIADTVSGKVCDTLQEWIKVIQVLDEREATIGISDFVRANRAKMHEFAKEANGDDMQIRLTDEEDEEDCNKSILNGVDTICGLMSGDYLPSDYELFAKIFGIDLTGCE